MEMVWKFKKKQVFTVVLGPGWLAEESGLALSHGALTVCKENSMLGALTASRACQHGPLPPGTMEWRRRQPGATTYWLCDYGQAPWPL